MRVLTHIGQSEEAFSGMKNRGQNLILNSPKAIHLTQRAVNDEKPNKISMASFVGDFEAIVQAEVQKSADCVALIKKDIYHCRAESRQLRKQLYLETAIYERARLISKIAANQQWIVECEEHILLIHQRAAVLQKQLRLLPLQNQAAEKVL